ncbi:MAG: deoxyribose-phosphate aldolase [Alphaproteobacteria bacterium]
MTADLGPTARRALAALDLTDLTDDCDGAAIERLCARAVTPHGPAAAVCIWPRFVAQARPLLAGTGVKVATVVNFPSGDEAPEIVEADIRYAIADGADEIDLVMPYRALIEGRDDTARAMVALARTTAPDATLKVILETGELGDPGRIEHAAYLAIAEGANFIKTSTGKVRLNATPEAARIMLEAIAKSARPAGLKPAGGIRTVGDAGEYLALADAIMGPGWATPERFRLGASGVLDVILATLDGSAPPDAGTAY